MGSEWRWRTLGELTDNFDSRRVPVKEPDRRPGEYPYYGDSGVVDHVDQYLYDGEYLLIAEDGENLKTRTTPVAFLARGRFWVNNHAHVVRGNSQADTRFLMYALAAADINGYLSGSAMPKLTQASLNRIPLFVPELAEQRRVADILSALDDKIELDRRMSQTLESMARALFKSWFVDFDPVRAKAQGRDTGLPHALADLFPDSFVDSQLGPIPIGWSALTLGRLVEVNPSRTLRAGTPAPYLDMANVPTSGHSPDTVVGRVFSSGSRFMNGDTLIARITPCLENGKASFVDFLTEGEVGWGSTEFLVLRPRSPVPPEFAYCLARSEPFREYAIQSMSGTSGRQRVSTEAVCRYPLVQPPDSVAVAFGAASTLLLGRAKLADDECHMLSLQRDGLLPRLMSQRVA
ncbi:MAG TPA: restriction endonuclease subunit S [Candidatus Limnocylindrales bacterium]